MTKYDQKTQNKMEKVMHEFKEGKLKSGKSKKKVTDRKQAIANTNKLCQQNMVQHWVI